MDDGLSKTFHVVVRHFEIFWVRKLEVKPPIDTGQRYLGDLLNERLSKTDSHAA